MHAANARPAPRSRVRLLHMLVPVALSVGLLAGGYMMLTDLADGIASTVRPLDAQPAPAAQPMTTSVAANAIAAN